MVRLHSQSRTAIGHSCRYRQWPTMWAVNYKSPAPATIDVNAVEHRLFFAAKVLVNITTNTTFLI